MSGILNPPLPRRDALPPVEGTPFYVTGNDALDICRLTGLSLDDAGMFIDLSRLSWWDKLKVMWAVIGFHYYADCNPWPERRADPEIRELYDERDRLLKHSKCEGCEAGWPMRYAPVGFPFHDAPDGPVGCAKVTHG
jgi:hypothetical protein